MSETGEAVVSRRARRDYSVAEKLRMVEATLAPGASVARVAQANGVNPNLIFVWANDMILPSSAKIDGCTVEHTASGQMHGSLVRDGNFLCWVGCVVPDPIGERCEVSEVKRTAACSEAAKRFFSPFARSSIF